MDNKIQVKDFYIGMNFLYKNKPAFVDYVNFDEHDEKIETKCVIITYIFESGTEMINLKKSDFYETIEIVNKLYKVILLEEKENFCVISIDDNTEIREIQLDNIVDYDDDDFMKTQFNLNSKIKELFLRDGECWIKIKKWRDKEIINDVEEVKYGNFKKGK
jgi:hypothetical protein